MNSHIPFFYIIRNTKTDKYYAGSKYGKDANPKTFMIETGYQTSSSIIKKLISDYGLEYFEIVKLKEFSDSESAYVYETRFLQKVDAKNHPRFYNTHNNDLLPGYGTQKFKDYMITTYGQDNPMKIEIFVAKLKRKKNSEQWKNTKGKESIRKRIETVSNPEWKETEGKEASEKRAKNTDQTKKGISISKTKNNPLWIETTGKESYRKTAQNTDQSKKGEKISSTKQSAEWKNNIGSKANSKRSETMQDATWKNTIGKEGHRKRIEKVDYEQVGKKISERRKDPEWIEKNKELCPHCLQKIPRANFARFHGDNCKKKIE